jgi:glyoxylase-like metal-dependent hydrolase (beta-lactamase superfamily II)
MIEVIPLRLGTIDVDVADLRFGHTGTDTLAVPMWAWLVRSGDEAILVDAGPPSLEWCAGNTLPVRDASERQLHEALARHGIAPRAVRTVVLTHLHLGLLRRSGLPGRPPLPPARLFSKG